MKKKAASRKKPEQTPRATDAVAVPAQASDPPSPPLQMEPLALLVSKRDVGNRYYAENEQAKRFLALLKQQALSKKDIEAIKHLGFRVYLIPQLVSIKEL